MTGSNLNNSILLADLSPVEIFGFATKHNARPGAFNIPYTRHKTVADARAFLAINNKWGRGTIYEFDFEAEQWVEYSG